MPTPPKADPPKNCARCGCTLQRKRYGARLEDRTVYLRRRFCSSRCANTRGVWGQSSTAQHRVSQRFRKPHCESCGETPSNSRLLHVHHINGSWRDHRPENLLTLCIRCHLHGAHGGRRSQVLQASH
jgi:hypothetical protein